LRIGSGALHAHIALATPQAVKGRHSAFICEDTRMSDSVTPVIGIIGGSGLYNIEGLTETRWEKVETPWGAPSDELLVGRFGDIKTVFLPRHGRGHKISPSGLNYRANIDALKRAGVTDIISLSAVGSLKAELPPGHFVVVDQFIDRSFAREKSFFGTGCVAHVSMAHPTCPRLGDALEASARELGLPVTRGGTYLVMEGPQFSTLAESMLYRSWGCDVIGMTNMPEAKLAREAEICYASVAMVTDYDCWHEDHDAVTVDAVIKVLLGNADKARNLVKAVLPKIGSARGPCPAGCDRALEYALITAPEARDPAMLAKLQAVAGRVL
jgi:5'-methylthioadenosine phosphorylase